MALNIYVSMFVLFFFTQQYNFRIFWFSVLDAFYQSLVAFFIPYLVNKSQTSMKTQYAQSVVSQVH